MSAAALLGLWAVLGALGGDTSELLSGLGIALLLVLFVLDIWVSLRR